MMIHEMKLNNEPFTLIKAGTKVIEMRLNDEKRRKIKIGDKIEFTSRDSGEKIMTEVIKMWIFFISFPFARIARCFHCITKVLQSCINISTKKSWDILIMKQQIQLT